MIRTPSCQQAQGSSQISVVTEIALTIGCDRAPFEGKYSAVKSSSLEMVFFAVFGKRIGRIVS